MTGRMVVMGMGITGRAVAESLLRRDIGVTALDDRISDEIATWAEALGLEVTAPTESSLAGVLDGASGLLPAPGLPDDHPIFDAAAAAGVDVLSEFDLARMWDTRPAVAVTGTDGKTTVVTLIQRMLERSGIACVAVGNTDTPYVEAIDNPDYEVFVVEASSFRLGHSQRFAPTAAVWLNFGPDHLDAHRNLGAYEAAKASIWGHLDAGSLAIANRDDLVVASHARNIDTADVDVETFGAGAPLTTSDHGVVDGFLVVGGNRLVAIEELARSLPHDVLNALAAAAAARRMGAHCDAIAAVLREFDGLVHRVELVGEIDGVRYVNDSKATTPHAAAAALGGFESVVLIAGGKNKGLAFDDMVGHADRIKHVVAIGDATADIEAAFAGHTPTTSATSMQTAVAEATRVAGPGDVVLLSPACASYDWYRSYVHRGEDFTEIVQELMRSERAATEIEDGGAR